MMCEQCHIRPGTIRLQVITEGQAVERTLCHECGQKQIAALQSAPGLQSPAPMTHLGGILSFSPKPGTLVPGPTVCPCCGYSLQQFHQTSMLGCPDCYQSFAPQLHMVLRRVQGGSVHHDGKIPARAGDGLRLHREIEHLRQELARAVNDERFEDAATLRDQVRDLERKLQDVQ